MDPANQLYQMMREKLSAIQAISYSIFHRGSKTMLFCFEIQKQILCLPFVCAKKILNKIISILEYKSRRPLSVAEMLTGISNPEPKDMLKVGREIRKSALRTLNNQAVYKLREYKRNLDNWDSEQNLLLKVNAEEIVNRCSINMLHTLNSKEEKLSDSLANLVSKDSDNPSELKQIKNNFKNLQILDSEFKEKRKSYLKSINNFNPVLQTPPKTKDLDDYLNYMQSIYDKSKMKNTCVQKNFSSTNAKLEEILNATECIKKLIGEFGDNLKDAPKPLKCDELKAKLEEQKNKLDCAEEERDSLKEKLSILEVLFQDQEEYLNSRYLNEDSLYDFS